MKEKDQKTERKKIYRKSVEEDIIYTFDFPTFTPLSVKKNK